MSLIRSLLLLALIPSTLLFAEPAPQEAKVAEIKNILGNLKYQTGEIDLHNGVAKLKLPESMHYLDPNDTEKVLVQIWGNPPMKQKTLGMIMPKDMSPAHEDCWAVIIEGYEEDGYVKDDDAAKINYNDLLKTMKEQSKEANEERVRQGYGRLDLVGWATPPHYDSATKKLYWAKELEAQGFSEHTLNYNIRILGRRGTLVLNAIAGMSQLKEIEAATPEILSAVDFNDGHRYADFNPATDKMATYGLAALIAGGVLAKAGFFKVLIAALLAGKKFVIIFLIAIGSFLKKLFSRKGETIN